MATGKLIGEVLKPLPHAIAKIADDTQSKRIAANTGEEFTKQIGGSIDLAGGRGANYLDKVAFPDHLASSDWALECCGHGVEIGEGEAEAPRMKPNPVERLGQFSAVRGSDWMALNAGVRKIFSG